MITDKWGKTAVRKAFFRLDNRTWGTAVLAASMIMASALLAPGVQGSEENDEACISITHIKRTAVIDDRTILFYMGGGRVLKAALAFDCPSLAFHKSFSYRAYTSRLCSRVDSIISRSGSHCPISDITAISRKDAKELEKESRQD